MLHQHRPQEKQGRAAAGAPLRGRRRDGVNAAVGEGHHLGGECSDLVIWC